MMYHDTVPYLISADRLWGNASFAVPMRGTVWGNASFAVPMRGTVWGCWYHSRRSHKLLHSLYGGTTSRSY